MSDQIQNSNLVPNADNTISLGSNSNRFSDVYASELHGVATYSGSSLSISNHNLGNLGDVTLSAVTSGDVLVWTGTTWSANSICNPTHLDNLTDVDTSGVTSGQVLRYNSTSGKWEAQTITPGSIGTTFVTLSDTPNSLTPNAFLKVNAGGTAIENFADPGYVSDLTSFTTTNLTEGTNLYYTDTRFDTRFATKDTDDLSEGNNQYFTNARFDSRLSSKTTTNLTEGTNLYYTDTRFDSRLTTKSTTDLAEGSNLYFTNTRADARINLQTGANLDLSNKSTTDLAEGSNLYYTDARADTRINTIVTKPFVDNLYSGSNETSDDIAEGTTNLYYTNARFDSRLTTKSTTDLAEGTNLYFTNTRADARITAAGVTGAKITNWDTAYSWGDHSTAGYLTTLSTTTTSSLPEGTNLYYTAARDIAQFNINLATKNTDDLSEGSNLYYTDARADVRINLQTGANLDLSNKSTTDLAEGSNQYFTNARVDTRIGTTSINALSDVDTVSSAPVTGQVLKWDGSKWAPGTNGNSSNANVSTDADTLDGFNSSYFLDYNNFVNTPTIPANTDNLAEGSNLYYTDARADTRFDTKFATKSTTNLAEGTNLYYTDTRFDTRLATKTTDNLAEGSNLYYTNARVDAHLNQSNPTAGHVLSWNGSDYFWTAQPASETFTSLVHDTTPQLGGTLDLNSNNITTSADEFEITTSTGANVTTVAIGRASDTDYTAEGIGIGSSTNNGQDIVLLGDINFTSGLINGELIGMWAYDNATSKSAMNGLAGATINGTTATIGVTYADAPLVIVGNSGTSNEVGLAVGTSADARIHVLDSSSNTIYKFPATDGTANQVLTTDGNGDLSWTAKGSGGSGPANTDALSEGSTNLYYTDARADARVNLQTGANLDLSSKSTTDLAEGTNLYYTDERVDDRVNALVQHGAGIVSTYDDSAGTYTIHNANEKLYQIGTSSSGTNGSFTVDFTSPEKDSFEIFVSGGDMTVNVTGVRARQYIGYVKNLDSVQRTVTLQYFGVTAGSLTLEATGTQTGSLPYLSSSHALGVLLNATGGTAIWLQAFPLQQS